jgi:hypothetical protein
MKFLIYKEEGQYSIARLKEEQVTSFLEEFKGKVMSDSDGAPAICDNLGALIHIFSDQNLSSLGVRATHNDDQSIYHKRHKRPH